MRLYRKTAELIWASEDPTEEVAGRWVAWCVKHDAMGWGSPASGCAMDVQCVKQCRWHPQGAFIPEVEAPK